MHFLYSVGLGLALVLSLPYWLLRMARQGKYRAGLGQRLGRAPAHLRSSRGAIWVHAVSVGEVLAVAGLIEQLRRRWPKRRVVVSTTTATGQALAQRRFGAENVFYFPLDFAFAIRPYLRKLRPELVVVAETEFWPNFLRLSRHADAQIAVVNARISDRSFPRYRRVRRCLAAVLADVSAFLAQSEEDKRRLIAIGAPADRVQVSGNLKFDIQRLPAPAIIANLRAALARAGAGPVIVGGSTVEGEEAILLRAFSAVLARYPGAVMVLAPRHPERFAGVIELLAQSGMKFWRRSQWSDPAEGVSGGILLLDSIGELAAAYGLGEVAFVGGSLAPRGGHNILEAAQHGAAILVGPHTANFRDIIALFRRADAVRVVEEHELTPALLRLLADERERAELGRRAVEVLQTQSGATERTLAVLEQLLARDAVPSGVTP
jgi:3-deoxy-D-manno-octulosonic-acid transferase